VALASQVLYAALLTLGYGCFSLWRRRRRRTLATDNICAIK
jgi:amino acid efflux transporter